MLGEVFKLRKEALQNMITHFTFCMIKIIILEWVISYSKKRKKNEERKAAFSGSEQAQFSQNQTMEQQVTLEWPNLFQFQDRMDAVADTYEARKAWLQDQLEFYKTKPETYRAHLLFRS